MAGHDPPEPVAKAEAWLDEHTMPAGDRPKGLEDADPDPTVAELRRQQRRETATATFGTSGQTRGAVLGAAIGAVTGLVVGALVGLVLTDASTSTRLLVALLLALAGSAAGFVYWGGRAPELENETMTASGEPGIGSSPRDPGTDDRGR